MGKRHAAMVLAAGLGAALWPSAAAAANGAVSMVSNGTTGSCANGYSYCFSPVGVSIPAGASVTWTNRSTAPHTVTADGGAFDSGSTDIAPGGSYTHTFTAPGTYSYHCNLHSYMTGTVTVTGGTTTTTTTMQQTTTSTHTTTMTRATTTQASTTTTRTAVPVAATAPPAASTSAASSAPVALGATATSSAASTSSSALGAVAGADAGQAGGTGGSGGTIAVVIAVVAAVALGGGAWWQRRRSLG